MKKVLFIVIIVLTTVLYFSGCKKDSDTDVGGNQSPIGEVGNEFSISQVQGVDNATAIVTSVKNGISTVLISGTLVDENLKELAGLIPNFSFGSYNSTSGEFTGTLKFKITNEGIVDYLNVAEKPFVLAKYDAKVGDTYTCEKANGGTFTRTVTEISEEDNFPYEGMWIKTITVEEPGRNIAINKIVYELNHKFGLVHANIFMQDGSVVAAYLHSDNINK